MTSPAPTDTSVRCTSVDIRSRKGKEPIIALTASASWMARLLDPYVDILLVGDSLGMVLYGMQSTLPVTLDMMIAHGRAVVNASKSACVVVDMPFGSYQSCQTDAFISCARVMKETGCHALKLEGGAEMADTIAYLTARGIAIMGHIALMPQYVNTLGGYRFRGRDEADRKKICEDALAVEKAGAFAVVLEGIEESLAREITHKLTIPTIGIGASIACDGQVLVSEDMLGITENSARFVKQYAKLGETISRAVEKYAKEVRMRQFPTLEHCYAQKK